MASERTQSRLLSYPKLFGREIRERKGKREKGRDFRERERGSTFSLKFSGDRTIGSRRVKRQSCSTLKGLCVGTSFMEFRKIWEVGVFSYLVYFRFKSFVNGLDGVRP